MILLNALRCAGVALQPQCPIVLPDGTTVHVDGGDPVRRFGVEVDHVTWHGGRIATQYDKWRDRQVFRCGWLVTRVTDDDIDHRLHVTVAELVELHRARPLPDTPTPNVHRACSDRGFDAVNALCTLGDANGGRVWRAGGGGSQ